MKNENQKLSIKDDVPQTKKCPFCDEEIKKEAIVCKHCQADLVGSWPNSQSDSQADDKPKCPLCGGDMKRRRIAINMGSSCLLLVVGLILLIFIWPVGLIFLVVGLILGMIAKNYWVCKKCGNKIERV